MSVEGPDVIPSPVDPDCECVRIGGSAHPEPLVEPPRTPESDTPSAEQQTGPALCPEGYVPRRRRRPRYELDGKRIRSSGPAEHNPTRPADER
jgi:hypothetical protein